MSLLYIGLTIGAFMLVGFLIVKRVHAAAAILFTGIGLLMLAAALGLNEASKVKIEPSGNAFYDELQIIGSLFSSRFSGIGMAIMVLFGFVAYMRHIGADAKAVVILSRPLARMRGSYWLIPIAFILANMLSLVVPSASALALLLIATLLPALVAAGLTPLTVGAVIATCSTVMPTPLEAGLIQGAELVGMPISEFVYGNVAFAALPTIAITAFIHMWWQRRCDIKDLAKLEAKVGAKNASGDAKAAALSNDAAMEDAVSRADKLPGYYALLPLLPLLLIIASAILHRVGVIGFEADILPVTIVSLMISVLIESIRHRDFLTSLDSVKSFFTGMGEGAAGVVSLLVAAAILVEGVNQMGVIKMLTDATKDSHGAATLIILVFVAAAALLAALTGSGTAPYFAFAEFVPHLAAASGVLPVRMLTAIWGTANIMRQVSPVCAAVLIVAGAIKVTPFQLVKRTAVPMISAMLLNLIFAFMFIHA